MERNLCQKKTLKVCLSLFCCLLLSLVFSFFSVNKAYAVDGSGYLSTFDTYTSYFDQSWHYNHHDGVVSLPYNLLSASNVSDKALSWWRNDVNWTSSDYVGSTNNIYNTITFKFTHTAYTTGTWAINQSSFSPSLGVRISDGSTKQGTCSSSVQSSELIITCSVVLENHTVATGINFVTGPSYQVADTLITIPRTTNSFRVVEQRVYYSYTGASDPNTALLQQQNALQQEANETLIEINNSINNYAENQRQQDQQTADDMVDDIETNTDISAIENKTTSILSLLGDVITAITSPTAGNCIIPFDISNYAGGTSTNVDLCHLSPPAGITNVLNIIFVVFVIFIAVSAVKAIFALYKEATTN